MVGIFGGVAGRLGEKHPGPQCQCVLRAVC